MISSKKVSEVIFITFLSSIVSSISLVNSEISIHSDLDNFIKFFKSSFDSVCLIIIACCIFNFISIQSCVTILSCKNNSFQILAQKAALRCHTVFNSIHFSLHKDLFIIAIAILVFLLFHIEISLFSLFINGNNTTSLKLS